jgi:predicted PurR-regulated permease PerM
LSPAVSWLQKLHIPRFAATLPVMLVSLSIASSIGYVIFNELLQVVNDLPGYRENINSKLRTLRSTNKGALAPSMPKRIVCFPANDEADEIAAVMLAQLLERAGCATVSVPLA